MNFPKIIEKQEEAIRLWVEATSGIESSLALRHYFSAEQISELRNNQEMLERAELNSYKAIQNCQAIAQAAKVAEKINQTIQ